MQSSPLAADGSGSGGAQALAERVRDTMFAADTAARAQGLEIVAVGPDTASVSMTVRSDMLNGFAICHGGHIALLADTAFAYACNAQGTMTVASGFSIELLAPARLGDRLVAHARARSQAGRIGVYDVDVVNASGDLIACFRGSSYRMKGRALPGLAAADAPAG